MKDRPNATRRLREGSSLLDWKAPNARRFADASEPPRDGLRAILRAPSRAPFAPSAQAMEALWRRACSKDQGASARLERPAAGHFASSVQSALRRENSPEHLLPRCRYPEERRRI